MFTLRRKGIALTAAIVAVLGIGAYFATNGLHTAVAADIKTGLGNVEAGAKQVALVDGVAISEADLAPFVGAGMDRAIAVDRVINKVVAANAAQELYAAQAAEAMRAAKAEVLSQVFINSQMAKLRAGVTDNDIKEFYDKRVKAEDFSSYRLKFFVSVDTKEAQEMYEALGRKDRAALDKLNFVRKDGDHFLALGDVPYGLGMAVKKLKAGERLQPVVVREGVLVLYVDDLKESPKPDLAKVANEIKDLIVSERFNEDMRSRRAAAKIQLKG